MEMQNTSINAIKLINLFSQAELPAPEVLIGGFNIDNEFYVTVEGKQLVASINVLDGIGINIAVWNNSDDAETTYVIKDDMTDDQLRDAVHKVIYQLRNSANVLLISQSS